MARFAFCFSRWPWLQRQAPRLYCCVGLRRSGLPPRPRHSGTRGDALGASCAGDVALCGHRGHEHQGVGVSPRGAVTVPNRAHTKLPSQIHDLTRDFQVEDVWALPASGPNRGLCEADRAAGGSLHGRDQAVSTPNRVSSDDAAPGAALARTRLRQTAEASAVLTY